MFLSGKSQAEQFISARFRESRMRETGVRRTKSGAANLPFLLAKKRIGGSVSPLLSMTKMKNQKTDDNENPEEIRQEGDPGEVFQASPDEAAEVNTEENREADVASGSGSLEYQLEAAREESRTNHERYLRSVADLENYRRRMIREKEELRKFALEGIMEDFLPVIDNFALGLQSAEKVTSTASVTEGFKMVADQIKSLLERNGLVEIDPQGQPFDPHQHEAVSYQPHEEILEDHVTNVVRKGYSLNGRLLRPASVVVSSGPGDA